MNFDSMSSIKPTKLILMNLNEGCYELRIKDFNVTDKVLFEMQDILDGCNDTKEFYNRTVTYLREGGISPDCNKSSTIMARDGE